MLPTIDFCVDNGVMGRRDVSRLLGVLEGDPKVLHLAGEFGETPDDMAVPSLDAGLAFLQVALLRSLTRAPDMLLSPGPVADAGWDVIADVPEGGEAWRFYLGVCQRFSEALGVMPMVIRHVALTPEQGMAARDLGAVRNTVRLMDSHGICYVPEHWPLDATPNCMGQGTSPCQGHAEPLQVVSA